MFDSHAHVSDGAFDADRSDILPRAQAAGVKGWIEIGTTVEESRQACTLAEQYEAVWATVGVHPDRVATLTEADWQQLEALASHPKVVAIGEVGFDFYRDGTYETQLPVLQRFVALAAKRNLPMVFHVRNPVKSPAGDHGASAHDKLLNFFGEIPVIERPRGVIHTFSGNEEHAKRYLELGLHLSFSGVVTFDNATETMEVAKMVPADRMLIETDCPYLTPVPHRGKRNEPSYVRYVAEKIAALRGVTLSEIDQLTEINTRTLFGLA